MADKTTVTERGQTAIPARLRHQYAIEPGTELVWEAAGDYEWRVTIRPKPAGKANPVKMLGFAKKFRATRRTAEWLAELREGEA